MAIIVITLKQVAVVMSLSVHGMLGVVVFHSPPPTGERCSIQSAFCVACQRRSRARGLICALSASLTSLTPATADDDDGDVDGGGLDLR